MKPQQPLISKLGAKSFLLMEMMHAMKNTLRTINNTNLIRYFSKELFKDPVKKLIQIQKKLLERPIDIKRDLLNRSTFPKKKREIKAKSNNVRLL